MSLPFVQNIFKTSLFLEVNFFLDLISLLQEWTKAEETQSDSFATKFSEKSETDPVRCLLPRYFGVVLKIQFFFSFVFVSGVNSNPVKLDIRTAAL